MKRWIARVLIVWVVFGLGVAVGAWVAGRHAAECKTQIVDFDIDGLTNAAQSALPAAATGSGTVTFTLDVTGIRVHADSMFANQTYEWRVAALVHGSPVTLELRSGLIRRLLAR